MKLDELDDGDKNDDDEIMPMMNDDKNDEDE